MKSILFSMCLLFNVFISVLKTSQVLLSNWQIGSFLDPFPSFWRRTKCPPYWSMRFLKDNMERISLCDLVFLKIKNEPQCTVQVLPSLFPWTRTAFVHWVGLEDKRAETWCLNGHTRKQIKRCHSSHYRGPSDSKNKGATHKHKSVYILQTAHIYSKWSD